MSLDNSKHESPLQDVQLDQFNSARQSIPKSVSPNIARLLNCHLSLCSLKCLTKKPIQSLLVVIGLSERFQLQ